MLGLLVTHLLTDYTRVRRPKYALPDYVYVCMVKQLIVSIHDDNVRVFDYIIIFLYAYFSYYTVPKHFESVL